jgi:hypothetical protein
MLHREQQGRAPARKKYACAGSLRDTEQAPYRHVDIGLPCRFLNLSEHFGKLFEASNLRLHRLNFGRRQPQPG